MGLCCIHSPGPSAVVGTGSWPDMIPLVWPVVKLLPCQGVVCLTGAMQGDWRHLDTFPLPLDETAMMGSKKGTPQPLRSAV